MNEKRGKREMLNGDRMESAGKAGGTKKQGAMNARERECYLSFVKENSG